jgi:hypothetical protein
MLLSHRKTSMPSINALIETRALVHTAYRIHVVVRQNVISEDALLLQAFERMGNLKRPMLTVLLEGRARLRACGEERWLAAGDVSLIGDKVGVEMRQEGDSFLTVAVEWEKEFLSTLAPRGFTAWKVARQHIAELREHAGVLVRHGLRVAEAAESAARLLSVLASAGAPFKPVQTDALVESVPLQMERLSAALDSVLSHLEGGPAAVDLEDALGVGARQVNRLVAEYNQRYGFNASGWRDTRNRRQLLMGATLMTAPGAVAERVAVAVGYGSARAFHRALQVAGLPAPSAIGDAVRSLA